MVMEKNALKNIYILKSSSVRGQGNRIPEYWLKWPLGWSINKKAAGWSPTPVGVGAKAN